MSYCIFTYVESRNDVGNFAEFVKTLSKTSGDYFFLAINCSRENIHDIIRDSGIVEFEVLQNVIGPGHVTLVNQGMRFAMENFSLSIYINSKCSLVASGDWLMNVDKFANNDDFSIGGSKLPIRITFSESLNKLLYATNKKDPSWISNCVNKLMITYYVDGNIFVVNNRKMKEVGFLDRKYHTKDNCGIGLSFKFMERSFELTDIPCIYSSHSDFCRHDIGNKIKEGADIVCPVVIKSVRDRILEV